MASSLISGIYPPQVETYNKTFIVNSDPLRIYFSLSNFNKLSDIAEVHVTLNLASKNTTVLSDSTGIVIKKASMIGVDSSIENDYKYYITISNSELSEDILPETIYKSQLRFSTVTNTEGLTSAQYFSEYANNFSEWSTLTIVRGIYTPVLDINLQEEKVTTQESDYFYINGEFSYQDSDGETVEAKDSLAKIEYTLTLDGDEEVLFISSENKTDNSINQEFYYAVNQGELYNIQIYFETSYGYTCTKIYRVQSIKNTSSELNIKSFNVDTDDDNGRILITIDYESEESQQDDTVWDTDLIIYRKNSDDYFKKIEKIHHIKLLQGYSISYTFQDNTAESGKWYEYSACVRRTETDGSYTWGPTVTCENKIFQDLNFSYLVGNNEILKLKYDIELSNYGYTVSDNIIQTIGGKYPIIVRNGEQKYRTFSISGTIVALDNYLDVQTLADSISNRTQTPTINLDTTTNLFGSKASVYNKTTLELFNNRNTEKNIPIWRDKFYERAFREKVMDFLYDGEIKLFKSATEGNILVRLTNISLAPKKELGRMIYSFSCTATEIDDCTIENMDTYNIQTICARMITKIYLDADHVVSHNVYYPSMADTDSLLLLERITFDTSEGVDGF